MIGVAAVRACTVPWAFSTGTRQRRYPVAAKKSKKRTQAADEGAAVRRWRDAMRHLLAVLAGGPKGTHRNDGSLFAEDAKERRYYSAIAARDATVDLVDVVRAARDDSFSDTVSVRRLAARLGKGDLLELDDVIGLWEDVHTLVDEIVAVTQGTKAGAAFNGHNRLTTTQVQVLLALPGSGGKALNQQTAIATKIGRVRQNKPDKGTVSKAITRLRELGLVDPLLLIRTPKGDKRANELESTDG